MEKVHGFAPVWILGRNTASHAHGRFVVAGCHVKMERRSEPEGVLVAIQVNQGDLHSAAAERWAVA